MAVVDKGGGVVEMVPRDEDGEVMETEEGSEVAVVKTVSAEDKRKSRKVVAEVELAEEEGKKEKTKVVDGNGGRGYYQPKW